jgi:hypothetical protein
VDIKAMSDEYIKSIKLDETAYTELMLKLRSEYGEKIKISWVAKRELGFTVRESKGDYNTADWWKREYFLDFYSEQMKTYFLLRYMA